MKIKRWIVGALLGIVAAGVAGFGVSAAAEGQGVMAKPADAVRKAYWRVMGIRTAQLRVRVVDAITQKGVPGAGCVIAESGNRVETNAEGVAPTIDAPVYRNPRLEEMLAELHGQLTLLCYKNGYRDAIYIGVRMHPGVVTAPDVWMYPYGPQDRRIEPTLYQMPVHRIWQIELADKYRLKEQGEGPERPALSRPDVGQVAPQEEMGGGLQTPIRSGQILPPVPQPGTAAPAPTPVQPGTVAPAPTAPRQP